MAYKVRTRQAQATVERLPQGWSSEGRPDVRLRARAGGRPMKHLKAWLIGFVIGGALLSLPRIVLVVFGVWAVLAGGVMVFVHGARILREEEEVGDAST